MCNRPIGTSIACCSDHIVGQFHVFLHTPTRSLPLSYYKHASHRTPGVVPWTEVSFIQN